MVNPFICGSGTFHHHQEDEDDEPSCSPRKPRKSSTCSSGRSKDANNPYANRGLDKFSALLAELEDKRQRLFTQMGSEDISFVRFVYSNTNDCKPIVVKLRDKNQEKKNNNGIVVVDSKKDSNKTIESASSSTSPNEVLQPRSESAGDDRKTEKMKKKKKKKTDSENMKVDMWRPCYYLPAIMILILLFLAVFGRSFTILCTCLGWYLVPTMMKGESSSNAKRPLKKKEYARRASEKKMVSYALSSPKSV